MTATEAIRPEDGGGQLYRFRDSSAAYVTVFVYSVPPDVREGGDSTKWVTVEGNKFAQVLPILVQQGRFDAFQMAFSDPDPRPVGSDTLFGFMAAAVTRSRGAMWVQLEYLYLVRGQFLKIRASLPQEGWQSAPITLFAHDLVQAFYKPEPR